MIWYDERTRVEILHRPLPLAFPLLGFEIAVWLFIVFNQETALRVDHLG